MNGSGGRTNLLLRGAGGLEPSGEWIESLN
jgi:hypothetical protein